MMIDAGIVDGCLSFSLRIATNITLYVPSECPIFFRYSSLGDRIELRLRPNHEDDLRILRRAHSCRKSRETVPIDGPLDTAPIVVAIMVSPSLAAINFCNFTHFGIFV